MEQYSNLFPVVCFPLARLTAAAYMAITTYGYIWASGRKHLQHLHYVPQQQRKTRVRIFHLRVSYFLKLIDRRFKILRIKKTPIRENYIGVFFKKTNKTWDVLCIYVCFFYLCLRRLPSGCQGLTIQRSRLF